MNRCKKCYWDKELTHWDFCSALCESRYYRKWLVHPNSNIRSL